MTYRICNLEVFENELGNISILDNDNDYTVVELDECMAEKLCKAIMEVAKDIREKNNGMD